MNDLTTALVMVKAYEHLLRKNMGKPAALCAAQVWLRDATSREISELIAQKELELGRERLAWTDLAPLRRQLQFTHSPDERPFAHPYFWAGFLGRAAVYRRLNAHSRKKIARHHSLID